MNAILENYKGYFCRPNSSDKNMVKECLKNYKDFNIDGNSIVLDFGGNIGAFGKMALVAGCKHLHIFEPEPSNLEMIEMNLKDFSDRATIHKTAVSTSNEPILTFYQSGSANKNCSGTVSPFSKRSMATRKIRCDVPNQNINSVLNHFRPTHLKIDIEGSEIEWLRENQGEVPDSVLEFSLEVHKSGDFFQEFDSKWFPKILEKFDLVYIHPNSSGFKLEENIVLPNMGINSSVVLWGIDMIFRRKSVQ